MNVTPEQKEKVKTIFKHCLSEEQDLSLKRKAITDLKKTLASDLNLKSKEVGSAYRNWKKLQEDPETQEKADMLLESIS